MRLHDLLAVLREPGDDEVLGRRIARLAQGAEPGRLGATFDLALRSGALSHDLARRLRQRLRALAEVEDPESDEGTQTLRDEIQALQARVVEQRATRSRLVAARERIAGLERQCAELRSVAEAARREVTEIAAQKGRLEQILTEVKP